MAISSSILSSSTSYNGVDSDTDDPSAPDTGDSDESEDEEEDDPVYNGGGSDSEESFVDMTEYPDWYVDSGGDWDSSDDW